MDTVSLREIAREPWKPISGGVAAAFGVGFSLLVLACLVEKNGFLPVLDHANLAFHEAGHVFFGLLGQTMNLYGGTLGQFVFPLVAMVIFFVRRETIGFAVCWVWLFQNFRYVATYAGDARARNLPLVGGGNHDWHTILLRWDALDSTRAVAGTFTALCWVGMLSGAAWFLYRYWKGRGIASA
jgi:hypothetical protein